MFMNSESAGFLTASTKFPTKEKKALNKHLGFSPWLIPCLNVLERFRT
jgi:hypothetical protein